MSRFETGAKGRADHRDPGRREHEIEVHLTQRRMALASGDEDLGDFDDFGSTPTWATLAGGGCTTTY